MDKTSKELDAEREREKLDKQIVKDKVVDFTKVIPTEMKFNTRVHPPVEPTGKSDAAILVQSDALRKCINGIRFQNS